MEVREKITGTMVVSINACKVPTRANERATEDGKKSYERAYRDSKVATVSAVTVDEEGKAHGTEISCVTGIEHADEFFPRIEVEMSRHSGDLAGLVLVILGDGAEWIWDRVAILAEAGQPPATTWRRSASCSTEKAARSSRSAMSVGAARCGRGA